LDEIGLAVYEEMSFKVKVYERMPDEKQSQKLKGELKTESGNVDLIGKKTTNTIYSESILYCITLE
jgi:hypothetical protein